MLYLFVVKYNKFCELFHKVFIRSTLHENYRSGIDGLYCLTGPYIIYILN